MDFDTHRNNWEQLARRDAMWAVLTWDGKENQNWQPDEFFATGRGECEYLMRTLRTHGHEPRFAAALDFGSGVGRMTQALADYADTCTGIDVSPEMVALAERHNRQGSRVRFVHNPQADLQRFADGEFDLVHSLYVLQHMRPQYSLRYLAEMLRVLRPGGVLVFQMASDFKPDAPTPPRPRTPASGPLPASARHADLQVDLPPLYVWKLEQGTVRVTNRSSRTWPALPDAAGRHQVKLGSRWFDRSGSLVAEDQCTVLPHDVGPGEAVALPLRLCAPETPATYSLIVDLRQEDAGWFADWGNRAQRMPVNVTREPPDAASPPIVEMYCVSRPRIVAHLEARGGQLLHVVENEGAGPAFVSHTYWVKKR